MKLVVSAVPHVPVYCRTAHCDSWLILDFMICHSFYVQAEAQAKATAAKSKKKRKKKAKKATSNANKSGDL
jgi:hypothetical protein